MRHLLMITVCISILDLSNAMDKLPPLLPLEIQQRNSSSNFSDHLPKNDSKRENYLVGATTFGSAIGFGAASLLFGSLGAIITGAISGYFSSVIFRYMYPHSQYIPVPNEDDSLTLEYSEGSNRYKLQNLIPPFRSIDTRTKYCFYDEKETQTDSVPHIKELSEAKSEVITIEKEPESYVVDLKDIDRIPNSYPDSTFNINCLNLDKKNAEKFKKLMRNKNFLEFLKKHDFDELKINNMFINVTNNNYYNYNISSPGTTDVSALVPASLPSQFLSPSNFFMQYAIEDSSRSQNSLQRVTNKTISETVSYTGFTVNEQLDGKGILKIEVSLLNSPNRKFDVFMKGLFLQNRLILEEGNALNISIFDLTSRNYLEPFVFNGISGACHLNFEPGAKNRLRKLNTLFYITAPNSRKINSIGLVNKSKDDDLAYGFYLTKDVIYIGTFRLYDSNYKFEGSPSLLMTRNTDQTYGVYLGGFRNGAKEGEGLYQQSINQYFWEGNSVTQNELNEKLEELRKKPTEELTEEEKKVIDLIEETFKYTKPKKLIENLHAQKIKDTSSQTS